MGRNTTPHRHEGRPDTCANCNRGEFPVDRYHVHLATGWVVELALCVGCRHKFVTADWVEAVV